ncbi:MAG TPA: PilC/PilY family type IV pilus protein, partial [Rhodanobacter sp.]
MSIRHRFTERSLHAALALLLTLGGGLMAPLPVQAATAPSALTELSPTPPNLTQAEPPNIVMTFDDSGSMNWTRMSDYPPYTLNNSGNFVSGGKDWSDGPWRCANIIDPDHPTASDATLRALVMNGVYYNPNITYNPPTYADGTDFPLADSTLAAVQVDGMAVNRPLSPASAGAAQFNNNPDLDYPSAGATTNLMGTKAGSDKRWTCGKGGSNQGSQDGFNNASPMDGNSHTLSDGTRVVYPNGGPYYYRLKTGVTVNLDGQNTPKTTSDLQTLYNASNWEAVPVSAAQYQNFANWYAYYRTRNQMARSSISRVFGTGGLAAATSDGGFGSSIRMAWQNLNSSTYDLPSNAIISSLIDTSACTTNTASPSTTQQKGAIKTPPDCYRSAFFNWLYQVPASGGTPTRSSIVQAGQFFSRGSGNTGATGNLLDPYWQPPATGTGNGDELVCRQNYQMLVTDGLWNGDGDGVKRSTLKLPSNVGTLPDGVAFPGTGSTGVTSIYAPVIDGGDSGWASLSDIAFHYWATDLRTDLYDPANSKFVAPYLPDQTTGVVTSTTTATSSVPATKINNEIYFNPLNDPATWPHMAEYLVGLGVSGQLSFSTDTDCLQGTTDSSDACLLRTAKTNSSGGVGWPTPDGSGSGIAANIDDTWHAALAGRGQFFSAGNPQQLIDQLSSVLTNISARNVPATTSALNSSVLVLGALGFTSGYLSSDWSGTFQAVTVNADGTVATTAQWDAGKILTDTTQTDPIATTGLTMRNILTSTEKANGSFNTGIPFRTFSALDNLVASPAGSTYKSAQTVLSTFPVSGGTADTGQARVDWLRGVRTLEGGTYRPRSTLLGAIIDSQAVYVSFPASGYRDTWPSGSPEATAIASDSPSCGTTTPTTCHTYESFTKDNLARRPAVYVGANDGMLHAFDASENTDGSNTTTSGHELFAYVPRAAYANLGNLTAKSNFEFAPTVDATPVTRDVFFGGAWHTLLVGGLRLGGRGVYALDITDPTQVTEANAGTKVLWEFSSDTLATSAGNPANLGYTFGQPNIGRLANGKWVVLVPGGYFPDCSKTDKPANCATIAAASNGYSSLFVLDAQTGVLIRELKTLTTITGVTSGGLSSAVLGDYNNDQVDDVAFAGDLNGNLWRFDLTDANPANWQAHVSLAFNPATQGAQPITVMPRLFPDPATNRFIVVFGTGKYLGAADNTSSGAVTQSIYGIRDELDSSNNPIT